jgi:GTP-binding protein
MAPIIVIVGRPNVGKSTLFNRLSRSRDALVDGRPGVTRDRLYASITYDNIPLNLVDTGGFEDLGQDPLLEKVKDQVQKALEEADRIIFVVDGRQGVMPGDQEMADTLRRLQKEVFLAVNKVDGPEHDDLALDFYGLGVKAVHPVSAAHGYGVRSLMEAVVRDLPPMETEAEEGEEIRVAVLGRPNVGKSSLINRVLGLDRLVVSELPGTTRDSVDTLFTYGNKTYRLIDTAGIRRRGKVSKKIEKFSVIKALRTLERCHVAVILLDAAQGVADQDARICGYALERGKAVILAVNKWDLIKGETQKRQSLEKGIGRQLKFISFAPRVNLSALTGERVMRLFDEIDRVYAQFSQRFSTSEVNKAVQALVRQHPPPRAGRGRLKLLYATQGGIRPPTFVVFVNRPDKVHFSYERFLINYLRAHFQLDAIPVRLRFRKRNG